MLIGKATCPCGKASATVRVRCNGNPVWVYSSVRGRVFAPSSCPPNYLCCARCGRRLAVRWWRKRKDDIGTAHEARQQREIKVA